MILVDKSSQRMVLYTYNGIGKRGPGGPVPLAEMMV
jgi:hypothetical protein